MPPERRLSGQEPVSFEQKREIIFERIFSEKAREGYVLNEGEENEREVLGWYGRYPMLSREKIDKVLDGYQEQARTAKVVEFFGARVEGELTKATVKKRIKEDKQSGDLDQLNKDKKALKQIKKDNKKLNKRARKAEKKAG